MIITSLCALIFSLFFYIREKSNWFSLIYLSSLPFIIFSGQSPFLLPFSFLLGYLLYCLLLKPSWTYLVIFLIILITSLTVVHLRSGLDLGMINAINSQRGEHLDYESSLPPKLFHNKIDLIQSFVNNFDKLLSPVAIFASGFWHQISPYYPLGFLFPWDLYFIYRYLNSKKVSFNSPSVFFFLPAISLLFLFSGLVYIDQALVFSFGVVYFLALLAVQGYSSASEKTKLVFMFVNSFFLSYHLIVSSYFKI